MKPVILEHLEEIPTRMLQEELNRREGVQYFEVGPYVQVQIYAGNVLVLSDKGPCTITHNYD